MIFPTPPKYHRPVARIKAKAVPPAPPPLVLVSASYDFDNLNVALGFDRDINVDGLNGFVIFVDDPLISGNVYQALGQIVTLDARTVQVGLNPVGGSEGTELTLSAGADNGIVAVDDGGAWPGVTDVKLPFG